MSKLIPRTHGTIVHDVTGRRYTVTLLPCGDGYWRGVVTALDVGGEPIAHRRHDVPALHGRRLAFSCAIDLIDADHLTHDVH
jgi:hypothetical protein